MKRIAIIGFGFCGKTAFCKLVEKLNAKEQILIFDAANEGFASAAFAEFSSSYILNVPAIKMSAFCDGNERDFCDYLAKNFPDVECGDDDFAPRYTYGHYLSEILKNGFVEAKNKGVEFRIIKDEVLAVKKSQDNFLISTKSENFSEIDEVILATSFHQAALSFNKISSKNFIKNLWNIEALEFHAENSADFLKSDICLIGSGLTAVDVIVGLKKKNFTGKIYVVSRRGNFPKKHFKGEVPDFIELDDAKKGVLFLCLKIRKFLAKNPQFDLRKVIEGIRNDISNLWRNFDEKNKKLFLRLLPYWNIFRHRAPEESINIIENMIELKQIEVKNGGFVGAEELVDGLLIKTKSEQFKVDYLVNCLGFEFNAKKYPLLQQMIEDNLLEKDLLMVESKNSKIHLLGGLNIGRDFECTAVPDLRVSVQNVVDKF